MRDNLDGEATIYYSPANAKMFGRRLLHIITELEFLERIESDGKIVPRFSYVGKSIEKELS